MFDENRISVIDITDAISILDDFFRFNSVEIHKINSHIYKLWNDVRNSLIPYYDGSQMSYHQASSQKDIDSMIVYKAIRIIDADSMKVWKDEQIRRKWKFIYKILEDWTKYYDVFENHHF